MKKKKLLYYINNNESIRSISSKENISPSTVRYYLSKFNLKTKNIIKNPKCKFCGETNHDLFMKNGKYTSKSLCKKCHSKNTVLRFRKNKERMVAYKGGKCSICGYNKCLGALDFHHLDPKKKDINWIKIKTWSFEKAKKELDKCILVCSNCHREIHWIEETI